MSIVFMTPQSDRCGQLRPAWAPQAESGNGRLVGQTGKVNCTDKPQIAIWLVVLVAAALLNRCGKEDDGFECYADDQCQPGEWCQEGHCSQETGCTSNADCKGNRICVDGLCVFPAEDVRTTDSEELPPVCFPNCSGKECGGDGCGGTCFTGCSGTETCQEGTCVGATEVIVMNNAGDACTHTNAMHPSPEEGEHLAASRLPPPKYPLLVNSIEYHLVHEKLDAVTCNAGLAHSIEIYVDDSLAPKSVPDVVEAHYVETTELEFGSVYLFTFEFTLSEPLLLKEGQHIFVAVKMPYHGPDALCLLICMDDLPHDDANYWSNADAPPYAWMAFESAGIPGNIILSAYGTVQ